MNTTEKIKFIASMTKYSIMHLDCGIEFINWYLNTRKDKSRPTNTYSKSFKNTTDVLQKLFPDREIPEYDLSHLNNHCNKFLKNLDSEHYPSKNKPYPSIYSLENDTAVLLYLICKILKPEKVVETGVAYGRSSSYILQALHENNFGKLYSIDYSFRPWESKQMLGSMIPDFLRNRWELIYGIAHKKLKPLLDSLQQIDIFIHDSAHTYNNMMFEYNTAWPILKNNGLLLSDDIILAFHDFSITQNIEPIIFSENFKDEAFFGILQK